MGLAEPVATEPPLAPSSAETTYPVMAEPLAAGALKVTVAEPSPGTTCTAVGAPGVLLTNTSVEGTDDGPWPMSLDAATVTVYRSPGISPAIVIGYCPAKLDPPEADWLPWDGLVSVATAT